MCGLAGAAGNLAHRDADVFRELMFVSCFRGIDSTGMAWRSHADKETSVIKMTVPSPDFLDSGKVKRAISEGDMLLMGHTRWKTVGEINKRNAQPFDFENVVGCHNGTLSWQTKGALEGKLSLPTDSEALYTSIANNGFEETIKNTNDEDAMALTWFDKEAGTLNFYRNKHRTLYYTYNKEMDKVYWASEVGMLYLVLNRQKPPIEFTKVKLLPENLHWSVKLPEGKEKLPQTVTRFCEQPKKVVAPTRSTIYHADGTVTTNYGGGRQFSGGRATNVVRVPAIVDTTAKVVTSTTPPPSNNNVLVIHRDNELRKFQMSRPRHRDDKDGGEFYILNGKIYDKDKFEDKMFEGCCICGAIPVWGEPVKLLKDDGVVCAACVVEAKGQYEEGHMSAQNVTLLSLMS